jgi:hypothetical protein
MIVLKWFLAKLGITVGIIGVIAYAGSAFIAAGLSSIWVPVVMGIPSGLALLVSYNYIDEKQKEEDSSRGNQRGKEGLRVQQEREEPNMSQQRMEDKEETQDKKTSVLDAKTMPYIKKKREEQREEKGEEKRQSSPSPTIESKRTPQKIR